jgi:hypothetical protein
MSWRRWILATLRVYPAAWRDRYGEETTALVDDLLAAERPRRAQLAADLGCGAVRERWRPSVPRPEPFRRPPPYYLDLWRHRDRLGRTRLDPASRALFAPAEQVLGTFDAVTAHPDSRNMGQRWLGLGFLGLVFLSLVGLIGGFSRFSFVLNHPGTFWGSYEFLVVGLLGAISTPYCKVTGAHRVMFSLTTQGSSSAGWMHWVVLAQWRRDPQRWRPGC